MPIAMCFIKDKKIEEADAENLIADWSTAAQVDASDITINLITDYWQLGNQYPVLIQLYLPTLWTRDEIERIQLGLLRTIVKNLRVSEHDVLIMTSLIPTGQVVENGQLIKW